MKYKCIIFDCDGVLVDSEAISTQVLIEMAASVGVSLQMEVVINEFSGRSLKSIFEYIQERAKNKLPESFEKDFRARTFEAFKKDLKPIDGVHELLHRLTVPFGVASSGPLNKIKLNLATTGLIDYFEGRIFSCYEIKSWKPDPGIYLHAAKEMGFLPNECAVIEDSVFGIQAAKSGGFDVFGLANEHNKEILEQEGVTIFYEMNALDKLLEDSL